MVGDREEQRERLLGGEVALDDPARESLGDRVGGDEAEASRLSGARRLRRLVPEVHDEIGAAGNVRAGLPDRLGVAVAQLLTDVLAADEGRVADDDLRLRPTRRTRVRSEEGRGGKGCGQSV